MPAAATNPAARPVQPTRRRRRRRERSGHGELGTRLLTGLLALLCLGLALGLAVQHPLGGVAAVAAVLLTTLLARYFWTLWPGWMLGLLPWIALAPWTGWTLVEEFDLLVLASAAGGYLAISGPHRHKPPPAVPVWRRELRWRKTSLLLVGLYALSMAMAVVHGLVDAGLDLQPAQHDRSAAEVLRAGKPLLWVLLLLPLWQRVARRVPQLLQPSLQAGMLFGLAGTALAAVVERISFTGLTNFSRDYRTTGGFWEMQFGGAALDGMLAMLLPFALLAVLRWRAALPFLIALAVLLVAGYAALTTFSRGLYLGMAFGLSWLLWHWQRSETRARRGERDPASSWLPGQVLPDGTKPVLPPARSALLLFLLLAAAALCGWVLFPTSGYRGLLALLGCMVLLFVQPPAAAPQLLPRVLSSLLGLLLAAPLVVAVALLVPLVDKIAYVAYGLGFVAATLIARLAAQGRRPWHSPLGDAVRAAGWFACLGGVAVVAWSWGGEIAFERALLPLSLLALLWPLCQGGEFGRLMQQLSWRARGLAMGSLLLVASVIAALGGGAYLADRLSRAEDDFGARLIHWSRTLSALEAEGGWTFGAGAGRFVAVFASDLPADEQIGEYRAIGGTQPHLRLKAGRHVLGHGELLRLTQRLDEAPAGLVLELKARNAEDVRLHVEVCEKHLLYSDACVGREHTLKAQADGWRAHRIELGGHGEVRNRPQFAIAIANRGGEAALTALSLRGADGRELLKNGDFRDGLERWLATSERHHLPWHAKNIGLHLLYEQGLVGLLLGASLFALALGRLMLGSASDHPLAPAMAGALIAFLCVGLFDSLLDAPRVAFVFYSLLLLSLGLRAPPPPPIKLPVTPSKP